MRVIEMGKLPEKEVVCKKCDSTLAYTDADVSTHFDEIFGEHYVADFHIFRSIEDYQKFIIKYPKFEEILRSYLDVDLERVILRMARSRKFDLSRIDMDGYREFDEVTHKKLEKILR